MAYGETSACNDGSTHAIDSTVEDVAQRGIDDTPVQSKEAGAPRKDIQQANDKNLKGPQGGRSQEFALSLRLGDR
jgi:hypothetical protein